MIALRRAEAGMVVPAIRRKLALPTLGKLAEFAYLLILCLWLRRGSFRRAQLSLLMGGFCPQPVRISCAIIPRDFGRSLIPLVFCALLATSCAATGEIVASRACPPPEESWTVWSQPQRPEAEFLLVFIHGLCGDPQKTWKAGEFVFPEALGRDLGRYDVASFGYVSTLASRQDGMLTVVQQLRDKIEQAITRRQRPYKAIRVVAHSMGGIIARLFVLRHRNIPVDELILLASPGKGSVLAETFAPFFPGPILDGLKDVDRNQVLDMLNDRWAQEVEPKKGVHDLPPIGRFVYIHAAWEEVKTFDHLVVSKDSATTYSEWETKRGFAVNHFDIARPPKGKLDDIYTWTLARLRAGGAATTGINNAFEKSAQEDVQLQRITGEERKREGDAIATRANHLERRLGDIRVLWVDDHPENNIQEISMFRSLGLTVETALSTQQALDVLERKQFDVLISDMRRDEGVRIPAGCAIVPQAGSLRCLQDGERLLYENITRGRCVPTIFYFLRIDWSLGVPPGALAMTNRPDHLLNYVFDVVERNRQCVAVSPEALTDRRWQ